MLIHDICQHLPVIDPGLSIRRSVTREDIRLGNPIRSSDLGGVPAVQAAKSIGISRTRTRIDTISLRNFAGKCLRRSMTGQFASWVLNHQDIGKLRFFKLEAP